MVTQAFGKYEVVRCIGQGGMGTVWEGRHVSLGTQVAIKVIERDLPAHDDGDTRRRFETEARAAAALESKHTIRIFDHGTTDDGKPYIVMELLTGESLDARITRKGTLSLAETAHVIRQVCRGLAHAHEHGIIHRDLKPENVFLAKREDDDESTAKILDFGIAKLKKAPGEEDATTRTKTGTILGTPFYMSPEQARGLREVDHRTDLWSLAVIAYQCTTGRLPFDGDTLGDLLVKISTAPIPIPSSVNRALPRAFDMWFARALERDPRARFSSATELADTLEFAAGSVPAIAETVGQTSYRRPDRKVRTAVSFAAAFVGVACAAWLATRLVQTHNGRMTPLVSVLDAVPAAVGEPIVMEQLETLSSPIPAVTESADAASEPVHPHVVAVKSRPSVKPTASPSASEDLGAGF